MAILIIGPSSVGKSTFISSEEGRELRGDSRNVIYGFQIADKEFSADTLVHYNMLHHALSFRGDYVLANEKWDFRDDPIFVRIVQSGLIEKSIVMVAPRLELVERIERRTQIEPFLNEAYKVKLWKEITEQIDIFRVYEHLLSLFDQLNIPYRIIFSSAYQPKRFQTSDRKSILANLEGRLI